MDFITLYVNLSNENPSLEISLYVQTTIHPTVPNGVFVWI